jgi:hypothetical protein
MPINVEFFKDATGADKVFFQFVGEKTTLTRDVKPEDLQRFPNEWKAYCSGDQIVPTGTPLEKVEGIEIGHKDFLAMHKIFSVEQLADLPDITCQQLGMGWLTLRNGARDYVREHGRKTDPLPQNGNQKKPLTQKEKEALHQQVLMTSGLKKVSEREKVEKVEKDEVE